MVTSSKKSAATPAAKKPVAKKVVAVTPAKKTATATTKKAATTPAKKIVAVATKKVAATPVKKVSAPKIEKPASKPAATAKSAPAKSTKKNTVTSEERYKMIATAAYFRAEQRGFASGHETEDWLASVAQIDAMLNA